MSRDVRVVLVGVGGFGGTYVDALLDHGEAHGGRFVAVVDPTPEVSPRLAEMINRGVAVHKDLASFHATGRADLVIIAAPIHLHVPFACEALARGANVLCEKPLAGSVREALAAAKAAGAAGRFLAVGYQWSFSDAVGALKRDILAGDFGRPVQLKTLCVWPRNAAYYARNNWAGRLQMPDGAWVLDSPANNAMAHYLHNMLYLLGLTRETADTPATVQAELHRANPIENYDTAAIRCKTRGGAEILFYTTHAAAPQRGPLCRFEFERAVVAYDANADAHFVATMADGSCRDYGNPDDTDSNKIWQSVEAIRTGEPVACDVGTATAQTVCVVAAQRSAMISPLPADRIESVDIGGSPCRSVRGLGQEFLACYDRAALPSELPLPWAVSGKGIDTRNPSALIPP